MYGLSYIFGVGYQVERLVVGQKPAGPVRKGIVIGDVDGAGNVASRKIIDRACINHNGPVVQQGL